MNHAERINYILSYIEENIDSIITVNILARKSGLSRFHFHRIFKTLVGVNPMEWVECKRMQKASVLLATTKMRVVDIAFSSGFQSHEYFTRRSIIFLQFNIGKKTLI